MKKKLLLINPSQSKKTNLANLFTIPSASLGYLAALTPSDWDIKINDENIEKLTFEDADLVGRLRQIVVTADKGDVHQKIALRCQFDIG